jgi:hypothetical protein
MDKVLGIDVAACQRARITAQRGELAYYVELDIPKHDKPCTEPQAELVQAEMASPGWISLHTAGLPLLVAAHPAIGPHQWIAKLHLHSSSDDGEANHFTHKIRVGHLVSSSAARRELEAA